jgi:pimeloyl-ACP methyl ester carboxylesterase
MPTPRDRHAVLNGLRFHWLDWGMAGLPPLVLLHGAAQTAHSFDEVAPALSRRAHVLALDQRGHGDTAWAPRYDRDDFVADVEALLAHHGIERTALVAMSLGGLNAIRFTARHPDRVRALVVVDVVPRVAPGGAEAIGKQLATREFASFDEAVASAHAFNPRRTLDNIRERLRHSMRELPDGRWTYKFDPEIASGARELERLWHDVRRLRVPVLLVRGAESPILDREGVAQFLASVPGSRVAEVAGAGHSVMGDNPAGFLAAVEPFLARHPA